MNNRLYIGGLPYSSTAEELKSHFAQAGSVINAQIITDRMTGRSRGFGFVEMGSEDEANQAITMFNGKDFGGRNLTVNIARPKSDRE
jgi:RNA recognition motif-containing protein